MSPELIDELREHVEAGRITHIARAYEESDLDGGYEFVMVATDDGAINAEVKVAEADVLRVAVGLSAKETAQVVGTTPEAVRAARKAAAARASRRIISALPCTKNITSHCSFS